MNTTEEKEQKPKTGLAAYQEKLRLEKIEKDRVRAINNQTKELALEELIEKGEEVDDLDMGIDVTKTYVFETLIKSETPRHEMLSTSCKIFDGNRMREIKYLPIADTIFVDEMGKRYDGYPLPVLSFHRDQLIVPGSDVRLVEYLLSHDEYDGNKNRLSKLPAKFTLVNKNDLEDRKEARHALELKALNIINETDIKELLPVSRVVFNIMDSDEKIVKNKLRDMVKTKPGPDMIIKSIDSPRVKRSYVMQAALDQGLVEVDTVNKCLLWSGTRVMIVEIRATKDAAAQLDEITVYSFTDEGQKVYDILRQKIVM